ncbi:hypothetical protein [Microbacterium atlanticum]|uniref:hypothetical protein n=1 Tax=Microbacterium atlanticum TaxID=2782168 RepID=UPI001888BD0A|nr:hypothetical protein [Microbacterium atlanticum]
MDGVPSAPGLGPPDARAGSSRLTDAGRELRDLRARAFGPDADIDADPAALARLVELEDARRVVGTNGSAVSGAAREGSPGESGAVTAAGPGGESAAAIAVAGEPETPPAEAAETPIGPRPTAASTGAVRGVRQRMAGVRRRTWWWVGAAGAAVVVVLVSAMAWLRPPGPDATLQATGFDVDSGIIELFEAQGRSAELSTYRQFEPYQGVGVWSVEGPETNVCLLVWDRASGRFGIKCSPAGREATLSLGVGPEHEDGFGEWLAEPSIISFRLRDDVVDVFVRPAPPSD